MTEVFKGLAISLLQAIQTENPDFFRWRTEQKQGGRDIESLEFVRFMNAVFVALQIVDSYKVQYKENLRKVFLCDVSDLDASALDKPKVEVVGIVDCPRKEMQDKLFLIWEFASELSLQHDFFVTAEAFKADEFEDYKGIIEYYKYVDENGIILYEKN